MITFDIEYLPTLNEYTAAQRKNKYTGAKLKKVHTEACAWVARIAGVRVMGLSSFTFEWHEPTKRRDPDNICFAKKFILDGLVQGEMMDTDGWRVVGELKDRFIHQKGIKRPYVTVTITPVGG